MTTRKVHRRRSRRGWMSGMKKSSGRGTRTPLWQWIVGVPLIAIIGIAILGYLYVTYWNPKLGAGARWTKGEVLERVAKSKSDGTPDLMGSSILVRVEGKELRLAPRFPEFSSVAKGDMVEVEVSAVGGTLQAFSWRLPSPSATPSTPGMPARSPSSTAPSPEAPAAPPAGSAPPPR